MKAQVIFTATALALGPTVLGWGSVAGAQTVVMQPGQPPPASVPAPPGVTQAQPPSPGASSAVAVNVGAPPAAPELTPTCRVERFETRPNRTMLTIGLFTFGQAYVASLGIALTSTHLGDTNLWIPVLGPWLDLGGRPDCPSATGCGTETGYRVLLGIDGVLQTFGVFELVGAFLWPEVVAVTRVTTASGASVSLKPAKVGHSGYGLAAVGHF
jgi:hypothetical protein